MLPMNQETLVVAGASGFVGSQLIETLKKNYKIIALTRFPRQSTDPQVQWRTCDLYSMGSTFQAVKGASRAIYLVHSMLPQDRLFQASFSDTDLLIADNFIHACQSNGIQQIVYLGGLVPKGYVSPHLKSRLEVEELFQASGIPYTLLRAGMIVGVGGSSFEILVNLVRHLKGMILPNWTNRITQSLYIEDLVSVVKNSLEDPQFQNKIFDVCTGENIRYKDLIAQCSEFLGLKRYLIPVPIESKDFSKLWVSLFGKTNYSLVSPLVDSLLCDLPIEKVDPLIKSLVKVKTFKEMLSKTLVNPKAPSRTYTNLPHDKRTANTVRSIQRLPSTQNKKAFEISKAYFEWLPKHLRFFLNVKTEGDLLKFFIMGIPAPLLILKMVQDEFVGERHKFLIVGGLLVAQESKGWLEFRVLNHGKFVLAAIHEFVPQLPWYLYTMSQAKVHLWVMNEFSEFLKKQEYK